MASLLIPLLILSFPFVSSLEEQQLQQQQQQEQQVALSLLQRHEAQLNRLETLIESLSKSVSVLESSLSSKSITHTLGSISTSPSIAASKHRSLFSEKFLFSAVSLLQSVPSCAAVLPYSDTDGVSKYVAIGDTCGRTYMLSSAGDVILEIPAIADSPVTSILSYLSPPRKNESLLFTGHGDGSIAAHRISESDGGGWLRLVLVGSRPFVRGSRDLDSPPVVVLELYQVGRTRYIVAADGGGRIRVLTENAGTLYGTAIASSRPLAFMKQRLLFLTETGAGALDLR